MTAFYRNAKIGSFRRLQLLLPKVFGFDEKFGLADNKAFIELFKAKFGTQTFQDLRVPMTIIATNFANGQRTLISRGQEAKD